MTTRRFSAAGFAAAAVFTTINLALFSVPAFAADVGVPDAAEKSIPRAKPYAKATKT